MDSFGAKTDGFGWFNGVFNVCNMDIGVSVKMDGKDTLIVFSSFLSVF